MSLKSCLDRSDQHQGSNERYRLGGERQPEPEGRAFSYHALDPDTPAGMQLYELFTDVQTQSQAPAGLTVFILELDTRHPVEQFPDAALLLQRDTWSVVGNTHH